MDHLMCASLLRQSIDYTYTDHSAQLTAFKYRTATWAVVSELDCMTVAAKSCRAQSTHIQALTVHV